MTFDSTKWSGNVNGTGFGGPKNHTYSSPDALATIAGSGYFNAIAGEMDTGDCLYVYSSAATGGGGKHYRMTNTAGVITCTALS